MARSPGPWILGHDPKKLTVHSEDVSGAPGWTICTFPRGNGRGCQRESDEANARLIAASPDLLEWCKGYLALLEGMAVSPVANKSEQFFAHTTLSKMIHDLRRVIAKVDGAAD